MTTKGNTMKTALAILSLSVLTTLAPFEAFAVATGSVSLTDLNNDLAVVDGEGNLSITTSTTSFYSGHVAAHMFDGDGSTYADLNKNEGWIGIQLSPAPSQSLATAGGFPKSTFVRLTGSPLL